MNEHEFIAVHERRHFLRQSAYGLGVMALANLLTDDGWTAESGPAGADPLLPRQPHFAARAKNVIFLFMAGGPSQLDLFDPKPVLHELQGQPVPESYLNGLADTVV